MKIKGLLHLGVVVVIFVLVLGLFSACKGKGKEIGEDLGGDIVGVTKDDSGSGDNTEADDDADDNNNSNNTDDNDSTNDESENPSPSNGDKNTDDDNTGDNTDDNPLDDSVQDNDNDKDDEDGEVGLVDKGGGTKISILFQNTLLDGGYDNTTKQPKYDVQLAYQNEMHWVNRRPLVKQILSSYDADSMGFTEITWGQKSDIIYDFKAYEPFGQMRWGDNYKGDRSNELDLIMYKRDKFKLIKATSGTLWLSSTPKVVASKADEVSTNPATVVFVHLEHKETGEKIAHFNTHYSHDSSTAQTRQGAAMATIVKDFIKKNPGIPLYATGDYNVRPNSAAYKSMTSVLSDPINTAKKRESSTGDLMNTFPAFNTTLKQFMTKPDRRIDFCFTNEENMVVDLFKVIEDDINGKNCSDHYGLYLESRIYPFK